MSKMSGGFLAVQAKRSKERTKVNQRPKRCQLNHFKGAFISCPVCHYIKIFHKGG